MSFKFLLICFAIFIALSISALSIGGADIGVGEILNFCLGKDIGEANETILFDMRLPRLLMAILVGALLATSGSVVQSVFLNPLADPYIIGIAAAATFGAVVAYLFGLDEIYYGVFAFICATALSLTIFKLYRAGQSTATLLIIGIALSAFLGTFTSLAIYLIGEDSFKITAWMMGYLGSASWKKIALIVLPLALSLIYFYMKRFELNVLLSGDDEAKTLGVDTRKSKKNLLIVSSLIVGFSVAFTGMIGFVGLIIPHTLRILLNTSSNAVLIPASAIVGGLFLLFCDILAKSILAPIEVPIGVITSFFGAPFFLFLALKNRNIA